MAQDRVFGWPPQTRSRRQSERAAEGAGSGGASTGDTSSRAASEPAQPAPKGAPRIALTLPAPGQRPTRRDSPQRRITGRGRRRPSICPVSSASSSRCRRRWQPLISIIQQPVQIRRHPNAYNNSRRPGLRRGATRLRKLLLDCEESGMEVDGTRACMRGTDSTPTWAPLSWSRTPPCPN